jgi:hypothetical protein
MTTIFALGCFFRKSSASPKFSAIVESLSASSASSVVLPREMPIITTCRRISAGQSVVNTNGTHRVSVVEIVQANIIVQDRNKPNRGFVPREGDNEHSGVTSNENFPSGWQGYPQLELSKQDETGTNQETDSTRTLQGSFAFLAHSGQ